MRTLHNSSLYYSNSYRLGASLPEQSRGDLGYSPFVVNKCYIRQFKEQIGSEHEKIISRFIAGFVGQKQVEMGEKRFSLSLISRNEVSR